jgi:hypothetical protein
MDTISLWCFTNDIHKRTAQRVKECREDDTGNVANAGDEFFQAG